MRDAPEQPLPRFTVLIAAPLASTRRLEQLLETGGYAVLRAESTEEVVEVACAAQPAAVILGTHAPEAPGVDVCRQLAGDPRFAATTPVILVTDGPPGTLADAEAAYRMGVWDVCRGDQVESVLLPKLRTFVRAQLASDRWREGSLVDAETGAYAAAGLRLRVREVEAAAARGCDPVSCVALHFTLPEGRVADRSLVRAVEACRALTRGSDLLGRLGAAEFGLVAVGAGVPGAAALIARVQQHVERRAGCVVRAAARTTPACVQWSPGVMALLLEARQDLRRSMAGAPPLCAAGGAPPLVGSLLPPLPF